MSTSAVTFKKAAAANATMAAVLTTRGDRNTAKAGPSRLDSRSRLSFAIFVTAGTYRHHEPRVEV